GRAGVGARRPTPPVLALRFAHHCRRVCLLQPRRDGQRARTGRCGHDHRARCPPRMNKPFDYGDRVLLLDGKQRRYLITLKEGGEFHSHNGFVPHVDLVGEYEGAVVRSTKGSTYTALRPTLEDFVVEMPRGAQVIYPKDLAPICMLADIGPGVSVFE